MVAGSPALIGSFPGTVLFFGTYELSKRHMIDYGVQPQLAYLAGGTFETGFPRLLVEQLTEISS